MKLNDILNEDYRNEFGPPDSDFDDIPGDDEFKPVSDVVDELGIEEEVWNMMLERIWRDNNREGVNFKHNIITLAEIIEDGVYHEANYDEVYDTLGAYDYDQHNDLEYRKKYVERIEAGINKLHKDGVVADSPDELRKYW